MGLLRFLTIHFSARQPTLAQFSSAHQSRPLSTASWVAGQVGLEPRVSAAQWTGGLPVGRLDGRSCPWATAEWQVQVGRTALPANQATVAQRWLAAVLAKEAQQKRVQPQQLQRQQRGIRAALVLDMLSQLALLPVSDDDTGAQLRSAAMSVLKTKAGMKLTAAEEVVVLDAALAVCRDGE